MKTIDEITRKIKKLPVKSQKEVLSFIEFLLSKTGNFEDGMDRRSWNQFSLDQAMRGMEEDGLPEYDESDLTEKYAK